MKTGLSLDDILLEPQYSDIESRLDVDLKTAFTKHWMVEMPIVSTAMPTITGETMMKVMSLYGGVGMLHRFMSTEEQIQIINTLKHDPEQHISPIVAAVGVGKEELKRAKQLIDNGIEVIFIDIAHGHSKMMLNQIKAIKEYSSKVDILAGNVATYEGTKDLIEAGADGVRVGIGGGYACSTRLVTGAGVPNLTSLINAVEARNKYLKLTGKYIPIMMDGGIHSSGCITKSLAFGADTISLGYMLSGVDENPGEVIKKNGEGSFKKYYGQSSKDAMENHKGLKKGIAPEGYSKLVPYRGSVKPILEELIGGVKSGLTYSGAKNIVELRKKKETILLSNASLYESKLR